MSTIRILHVVGAMNRGGAETMLMNLYRALDKKHVQFDFLELKPGVSDYSKEIQNLGGRVLRIDWSQAPTGIYRTIRDLRTLLIQDGPFAAVHSHILFASGTVMIAAVQAGIKVRVAHAHSTNSSDQSLIARIYRTLARRVVRNLSNELVGCSIDAGEYVFGKRSFQKNGIVIRNAIDLKEFYPAAPQERLKLLDSLDLDATRLKILSVARMEPVKNHDFLLKVAAELEAMGQEFDLIFVGDGSMRSQLESDVDKLNLAHRIHFWGTREDVADILRSSDLLVMPSHFEGLPVALVEAQATGLPCFVSDNVALEADMGLGLVTYLSTASPLTWAQEITRPMPERPSREEIHKCLSERGYTVERSVENLLEVYGLENYGGDKS